MPAKDWKFAPALKAWQLDKAQYFEIKEKSVPRAEFPKHVTKQVEIELRSFLRGEVRFDDGSRALYATGGSNYRQIPIGIVIPRDKEDVINTLRICNKYGAPVLSVGGGTGLAGQSCNVAVVMDMSKYLNQIISIDPKQKLARVMPGVILDHLRKEAEKYRLTFGPDPATHNHCTLGGMIGNNSCGVHSQMAGRTADNIHELEIITYDGCRMRVGRTDDFELEQIIRSGGRRGEIYSKLKDIRNRYADLIRERFPRIPRRVSGYNLDELLPENGFHVARALVGTEGTCVTVLEATTNLVHSPPARTLLVLGYSDVFEAGDHVPEIREFNPIGLEGLDNVLVENTKKKGLHPGSEKFLPEGKGWLLVEFGGDTKEEADAIAKRAMDRLKRKLHPPSMKLYTDPEQEETVWKVRESGLGATARVPGEPDTWEGWEDSAVPPERVGDYLRDLRKLFNKFGYNCALYGHFGQGCIHTRIDFDFLTAEGVRKYRSFMDEATDLVLSHGGSLSGEHGDGQSRAEFLPKMFGPELIRAFEEFKAVWDPQNKMNPNKVVHPYRIDDNLRLGSTYNPAHVETHFKFPDDKGSFSYATLRCVGVGKCRRQDTGTMCPSFMVTLEEKDSTRGRAHLLNEMLRGDFLKDSWKSEAVKDALSLCLACKGCKGECPINVDMATYKAEFLSHYYEGRMRPITAYSMGLIDVWARMASKMPGIVNFLTQTPILRDIAKKVAGIASERQIPKFAQMTFKEWFQRRGIRNEGSPKVVLWADTFNNYFHPETAIAAVEVLEDAGFQVLVHQRHLCCGRPLYDYGMLDRAKIYLQRVMEALKTELQAGVPIIGLEPSCVAVFRDELRGLFPNDLNARRFREQIFLLSEFLEQKASHYKIPQLKRKAIVQGHCHHKSTLGFKDEKSVLSKLGLDYQILDSGCCGMAGSFGFESESNRYDVSMKVGERVLLPTIRRTENEALIIADGFSCRTQIEQGTGRRALHLSQVIQLATQAKKDKSDELEVQSTKNTSVRRSAMVWGGVALGAGALLLSRNLVKKNRGRS